MAAKGAPAEVAMTLKPSGMAHPHRLAVIDSADAGEQGALVGDDDVGPAELASVTALDLAAQHVAQQLLAIADGQHRQAQVEQLAPDARTVGLQHAGGPARQDDGLWLELIDHGLRLAERMDLAIDARLAQAPRDQLRHLAAEIDDQDLLVVAHEVLS